MPGDGKVGMRMGKEDRGWGSRNADAWGWESRKENGEGGMGMEMNGDGKVGLGMVKQECG